MGKEKGKPVGGGGKKRRLGLRTRHEGRTGNGGKRPREELGLLLSGREGF